jgi:hypothetical protein
MVVGGERHAPAALPPEISRYPLCRRLGRHQGRSGRVRNISPPSGFDPRTVQSHNIPLEIRYLPKSMRTSALVDCTVTICSQKCEVQTTSHQKMSLKTPSFLLARHTCYAVILNSFLFTTFRGTGESLAKPWKQGLEATEAAATCVTSSRHSMVVRIIA